MTEHFAYLHKLAETAATGFATVASSTPARLLAATRMHSVMLWRQHQVQIELISVAPGASLPAQSHNCDEVIRFLGGQLEITLDTNDGAVTTLSLDDKTEAHRSRHLEIKAGQTVRGEAGEAGAIYLSLQNYTQPIKPDFLSLLGDSPWA